MDPFETRLAIVKLVLRDRFDCFESCGNRDFRAASVMRQQRLLMVSLIDGLGWGLTTTHRGEYREIRDSHVVVISMYVLFILLCEE